jgi:uncharacterized protein YuzE
MKIKYDPSVDALYIGLIDGPVECRVIQLNSSVAIDIGLGEQVVGIEVLDASEVIDGFKDGRIHLENLKAVSKRT